ncbi:hypothetical protein AGMMS50256_31680 [Betaproteobacteria bacterium]|nr:hypothetical protein AGMMS50256_31680 [Betaproteobacteria bacterium]
MFETIMEIIYWCIIENIFFQLGRMYLWVISVGKIKIAKPTKLIILLVAIFGIFMTLIIILFGIIVIKKAVDGTL